MINAVIVPVDEKEAYLIYKIGILVKVCYFSDNLIHDVMYFPSGCDDGELSYSVTEVVRIVQFFVSHLD